ncbi:MAG TPA: hypothetical protein VH089_03265 [Streptosporangiaceae bacterium]|nr:hypothetical protein [Streptosporangiaceae bacterium]
MERWDPDAPGVLRLPSGRLVRGRGRRRAAPEGPPPTFGIFLVGKPPTPVTCPGRGAERAGRAVAYVREHYDRRAVETPGQRRFVARWTPLRCGSAGPGGGGR